MTMMAIIIVIIVILLLLLLFGETENILHLKIAGWGSSYVLKYIVRSGICVILLLCLNYLRICHKSFYFMLVNMEVKL